MKLHEYLEDHGILMAGMLLVFLLQCVLLVFLGMPDSGFFDIGI